MALKVICVDDFGSEVHKCHYSERLIPAQLVTIVGAIVPGVKAKYAVSDIALHRQSKKDFDEYEANCNTCKNLVRAKHPKCKHGFLYGTCAKDGKEIMFHPDDWMGKRCYQPR